MKSLPQIIRLVFVSIFLLQLLSLLALALMPNYSEAASDVKFQPQVTVGDFEQGSLIKVDGLSLAKYIKAFYRYAIGIVGILATVVMMFGGFRWLTAGGDAGQIGDAKEWIKASITGLVIALSSFLILDTVNPDLVRLTEIKAPKVDASGCCTGTNTIVPQASCKSGTWIEKGELGNDGKCDICQKLTKEQCGATHSCKWSGNTCRAYSDPEVLAGQPCALSDGATGVYVDETGGGGQLICKSCKANIGDSCMITDCCSGLVCDTSTTPDTCKAN